MRPCSALVSQALAFVLAFSLNAQQSAVTQQAAPLLRQSLIAQLGNQSITDITLTATARHLDPSTTPSPAETTARDPQAIAILQQSFAAMGGAVSSNVSSVLMEGSITQQMAVEKATGSVTYKWSRADVCRLDSIFDSYSQSYVVNGHSGMRIVDGTRSRLPFHSLLNHQLKYLPVFSEISMWADSSYSVSYVALETLNGSQVHHIHLEEFLPGLSAKTSALYARVSGVELYIDANSLLLLKRSQQLPTDSDMGTTMLLEQYFGGYKMIRGIAIAHQISEDLRGENRAVITVTSVQINQGVSASDFEVR
jgi:hypothetical protein